MGASHLKFGALETVAVDDPLLTSMARTALARDGIKAIWTIYDAAATVYLSGHTGAAQFMIEIADAAEELWSQRTGNE